MQNKGVFIKIRGLVSRIPKGKVVTYGDIANSLGMIDTRIVGWALQNNQDLHPPKFSQKNWEGKKIPCHRVVKKQGFLAKNYSLGSWKEQKRRLKLEGVHFVKENQVDLRKHYWKIP